MQQTHELGDLCSRYMELGGSAGLVNVPQLALTGRLGGSVGGASDFRSGRDLAVREFEPHVGLCADSSGPGACLGFRVSHSLCPSLGCVCACSLSLSLRNKNKLKKKKKTKLALQGRKCVPIYLHKFVINSTDIQRHPTYLIDPHRYFP